MKHTHLNLTIEGPDTVPLPALAAALAQFGVVTVNNASTIELKPVPENGAKIWVKITSDEQEPYFRCLAAYEHSVDPLTHLTLEKLLRTGVCTELAIQYPRTDRYGIPECANSLEAAKAFVAEHLFSVAEVGFSIDGRCSEDDTPESVWICMVIPV